MTLKLSFNIMAPELVELPAPAPQDGASLSRGCGWYINIPSGTQGSMSPASVFTWVIALFLTTLQ